MQYGNNRNNPDDTLVATFKLHAILNEGKTAEAGRPICDDMEVVEIRAPGSRNTTIQPAHVRSHWTSDQYGGDQREVTYAERFAHQYRQFKERAQQTKTGTPLEQVPFLTPARCSELRALNVYIIEQLAAIDGQELKNLGPGGRDLKNRAVEWIAESKTNAPNMQLQAALEAERAKNQVLQDDLEALKVRTTAAENEFEAMTDDQLRKYIQNATGHAPQGNVPTKMLIRMAMEVRPARVA